MSMRERSQLDFRSLLSERQETRQGKLPAGIAPSEEEKALALREYQRLVRQIEDALREQEAERRSDFSPIRSGTRPPTSSR